MRDSASRNVVATLGNPATTLSFAPRAKLLASGHGSGVKLWDTETWQEVRSLPDTMHGCLFSPDGRWLLTGVAGGWQLWDTQTWQRAGVCPGAPSGRWQARNAVAFSPDSKFLVTLASDGKELGDSLRVWRLPSMEELPAIRFGGIPIGSAIFSADGKQVLAGLWDGQIVLWDLAAQKSVAARHEHTGFVTAIAAAADGKTFVSASTDRTVNVWDGATFQHLVRLRGHVGEVWSGGISPDGRTVVSGSAEGTTKLWKAETRHTNTVLDNTGVVLGFLGGGRQLIAGTSDSICVWTPESGARMEFAIPSNPSIVSLLSKPYDVKPDEPLQAMGRSDGSLELWHLTTGAKITAWPAHAEGIGAVAFSSDGKRLATASTAGEVKIWDFATRAEVARIGPVDRQFDCLAFSPDGKTVAASGASSRVWLWEAASGREVLQLGGHDRFVPTVAFSPDGKLLATTMLIADEARLWELPSGKQIATLKGHVQGVMGVAFSPDGKTLATASHDRKVKLWNVATHQELATFPLAAPVMSVRFSPDGRALAIGYLNERGPQIQLVRAPSFEDIAASEVKAKDGAIGPPFPK